MDEVRDWAEDYVRRWTLAFLLFGIILFGAAMLGGCASEGVSKGAAVQATGLAAGVTWLTGLTGIATSGWSVLVGLVVGLGRLLFAGSTGTAPPGGAAASSGGFPWFWIVVIAVVWLKWRHILDFITGASPRFDALLRTLGLRTHKTPVPGTPMP